MSFRRRRRKQLLGKSVSCSKVNTYLTRTNGNFIKFIEIKVNIWTRREMIAHNVNERSILSETDLQALHVPWLENKWMPIFASILFDILHSFFYIFHHEFQLLRNSRKIRCFFALYFISNGIYFLEITSYIQCLT